MREEVAAVSREKSAADGGWIVGSGCCEVDARGCGVGRGSCAVDSSFPILGAAARPLPAAGAERFCGFRR
jgi:hypothetical protein